MVENVLCLSKHSSSCGSINVTAYLNILKVTFPFFSLKTVLVVHLYDFHVRLENVSTLKPGCPRFAYYF